MKKILSSDKKKRARMIVKETSNVILKSLSYNNNVKKITRWNASFKSTISKKSFIQINKRCVITGRKNVCHKSYKLSRLTFLRLANKGLITGVRKSVW